MIYSSACQAAGEMTKTFLVLIFGCGITCKDWVELG
jgi:hypothetical protein